jgi:Glycosyl transferase family 2
VTVLAWAPVLLVALLTAHTAVNVALLRRVAATESTVDVPVAVLLPVRDEAHRVLPCLRSVLAQRGVPRLSVLVLDDGSTDGTAALVAAVPDPRLRLLTGTPPPPGWLGKPYACHQLAAHAPAEARVLVFLDADVVLAPDAVAASVRALDGFELISPYPRLVAISAAERLVQPLLPWSWLTFLPLRAVERSPRPSLAAAGGQFLVVDRAGYERAGGHAGVRDRVLEDVELARAVKRSGGRISIMDGSRISSCRMYGSWPELRDGYTKSLWAVFGPPAGAAVVVLALLFGYALPLFIALVNPLAGLFGYLLGATGRVLTGHATGARTWPDALTQPLSIAIFGYLVARSYHRHWRGLLTWKGRRLDILDRQQTRGGRDGENPG